MNVIYLLHVVAALNLLIGSIVLFRDIRIKSNIYFFSLAMSVSAWCGGLGMFLSDSLTNDQSLLWGKFYYLAALYIAAFLFLFAKNFPRNNHDILRDIVSIAPLFIFGLFIALDADFLTQKINYTITGKEIELNSVHYAVYSLLFIAYFFSALLVLMKKRAAKEPLLTRQINYMVTAVVAAGIFGIAFNLILPWLGNYRLVWVGPVFSILFVSTLTYAILRHKLFDIRLFVARSLSYVLSLATIAFAYGLLIYWFSNLYLEEFKFDSAQITLSLILVALISVTFQSIRKFFDHATHRLFFRESYDSQHVLDELGSLLATDINLQSIVEKSSNMITHALNPSTWRFVVFKDGEAYLDIGDNIKSRHRAVIRPEIDSFSSTLIVRDEATEKEREYLDLYDADVLLKLRTNEETVGAILLGPKQSGTVYSKQDVDLLTISEKELAIAVQNSRYFEQIQEFNLKLQREVDEATSELRSSNEKLKALDEAKDEFVSMASHQLRTPLTSVKGYISMVIEGDAGKLKPEQKKLLEEAFASSQRMVYLIADLLNVSRLKTGKFVIEPSDVYLPDVVEQEVSQLLPTAKSRKLKLTFDKPKRFPKVCLDETKIRQVVMNFIDNAIYYTPAGGSIDVQLTAKRDRIEYVVKDDGIGVPKSEQPKLFTKFYRANNARKARPDGTGLGLYMAQRVVSAQGGSIIFESKENEGSKFGFAFPLKEISQKSSSKAMRKSKTKKSG